MLGGTGTGTKMQTQSEGKGKGDWSERGRGTSRPHFQHLAERVSCHAQATGYLLTDAAKATNAVCLDGTPPIYYHRKGTGKC